MLAAAGVLVVLAAGIAPAGAEGSGSRCGENPYLWCFGPVVGTRDTSGPGSVTNLSVALSMHVPLR
jgi:hypothetical protein